METSYEQAEQMLERRLAGYPTIRNLIASPQFKETLRNILNLGKVEQSLLPIIESELMIVLTFYAPLHDLSRNVSLSAGLPIEKSEEIAALIETLLLEPVRDELYAFEYFWDEEVKKDSAVPGAPKDVREKLDLRPEGVLPNQAPNTNDRFGNERPLTREEVLRSIAPKRTMASDIESVRKEKEGGGSPFGDSR